MSAQRHHLPGARRARHRLPRGDASARDARGVRGALGICPGCADLPRADAGDDAGDRHPHRGAARPGRARPAARGVQGLAAALAAAGSGPLAPEHRQRAQREEHDREQAGGHERRAGRRPRSGRAPSRSGPTRRGSSATSPGAGRRRPSRARAEAAGRAAPGRPRTTTSAARKIGTRATAEPSCSSASRSKRIPLVTKKNGTKTPKPTASSLCRNSGWVVISSRSTSFSTAPAMNAPRIASSPKRSASATSTRAGGRRRGRGSARSCPGAGAGRPRAASSARAPSRHEPDGDGQRGERDQQHHLRADAARVAGEEERQQHDREHVGDRRAAIVSWPKRRLGAAGVLQHRDHDPERGRREDDRDQERRADEPGRLEREPDAERERERHRESDERDPQQRSPQAVEVDLEPGEQEQEREPDEREHAHRRVVVRPAEHRRADDDARRRARARPRGAALRARARARAARRTRSRRRSRPSRRRRPPTSDEAERAALRSSAREKHRPGEA